MPLNQIAEIVKPPVNELVLGGLFKEARRLLTSKNITFEQLANELQSLIFRTIELSCGNITSKNIRARYVMYFGANRFWNESSNWFKRICRLPNAAASVSVYTTFLPFIRVEIFKGYKKDYLAKADYEPISTTYMQSLLFILYSNLQNIWKSQPKQNTNGTLKKKFRRR